MNKRNVAFFINSLSKGGAERVLSRISGALTDNYNLYIFLLDTKNIAYECSGIICDVGGNRKTYYGRAIYSIHLINKIIKEKEIECVISFLDIPSLINVLALRNCKKIVALHCFYNKKIYKGFTDRIKLELCHRYFKKADGVIPVSKALGELGVVYFGMDPNRIKVIENPYDVNEIISMAEEEIEEDIIEFMSTHKVSVAVGRLEHQKGHSLLLQCFAKVYKEERKAGLIIIGGGSMHNELEALAKKLGVRNQVIFLGVKENPFAYIAKSKIYVSTSLFEGFPNTLVEAMACGIPVIQTDCLSGPREILSEVYCERKITGAEYAEYGVLMPDFYRSDLLGIEQNHLIEKYAEVWCDMLNNEELQRKYGRMAQIRARNYTMEICIKKYIEIIDMVLDA